MKQQKSDGVFDERHYELLNKDRSETFARVFSEIQPALRLKTAVDIGCGLGHFSSFLSGLGLDVLGIDGREQNVLEARRRYPGIRFEKADVQDLSLASHGVFDLVFCYGLLYHLENPFAAIRSIGKMTGKFAAIESLVYPSPERILVLLNENQVGDQGLNYIAYYPSEACLVEMLVNSGLPSCYSPAFFPQNPFFQIAKNGFRQRTFLFASRSAVEAETLVPWNGHPSDLAPWAMAPICTVPPRLSKFYFFLDRTFRTKLQGPVKK